MHWTKKGSLAEEGLMFCARLWNTRLRVWTAPSAFLPHPETTSMRWHWAQHKKLIASVKSTVNSLREKHCGALSFIQWTRQTDMSLLTHKAYHLHCSQTSQRPICATGRLSLDWGEQHFLDWAVFTHQHSAAVYNFLCLKLDFFKV